MSVLHLRAAVRQLLPDGITIFDGQVDETPATPWLVLSMSVPDVETSEGVGPLGRTATLTVTVSGSTEGQTLYWAARVDQALIGARVQAPGWAAGAITPGDRTGPYAAGLTATDTNLRYQVARMGYHCTYSPIPGQEE